MARKVVVEMVDDIDGTVFGDDGESINYAVDGVEYVIDLKDEHATELRETFEYYIAHSTRVGGRKHRSDRQANPATARRSPGETQKIRAWAIEQGYPLSSRGRIPAEIEQAFHDAVTGADTVHRR
ncbi:Lsr2 family protein (plasmid) [Rhodococcus opacus]|uniref:histone-like nucleoid-structuring protein Lsr2 n=1 Tax=Rhodococcus opacus TaxID=37919 RepID=UPI001FF6B34C|nr:Lsr2 family protein [Rhodococcus opacus]UOT08440.1 Lsr2 family protein [Rhodococcus opacus]